MMRSVFCSFLFLAMGCQGFAQRVKVVSSSVQGWSGGIAGRWGDYYNFEIEFSEPHAIPDTIWMGQDPVPLQISDSTNYQWANVRQFKGKNSVKYKIHTETSHDDNNERFGPGMNQKNPAPAIRPPIKYNGVALLSYMVNDKKYYFEITKIITQLPGIAYP